MGIHNKGISCIVSRRFELCFEGKESLIVDPHNKDSLIVDHNNKDFLIADPDNKDSLVVESQAKLRRSRSFFLICFNTVFFLNFFENIPASSNLTGVKERATILQTRSQNHGLETLKIIVFHCVYGVVAIRVAWFRSCKH